MKILKTLLTGVIILAVVGGVLIGIEVNAYSNLKTDFSATGISPEMDTSLVSVTQAVLNVFQGNLLGAASSMIKGVKVQGDLEFVNNSFIPLYLPNMQNRVYIENIQTQTVIPIKSTWISPHGSNKQSFNILVDKSAIPGIALQALANGGQIDIKVESQLTLGTFAITKTTNRQLNVIESLSSYVNNNAPNSNAPTTVCIWSPRTTVVGKPATVSITISGGTAGTYTLEVLKDISLAADEVVASYPLTITGNIAEKVFSFTPSSIGSYYAHLVYQGNTVWSQPNDSSRLSVTSIASANLPLSVTNVGWLPSTSAVGKPAIVSITISGGTAGTYTLEVLKDISMAADGVVASYPLTITGNTTDNSFSFTPSSTGSYYVHLIYQGNTVWSQPNDQSRLRVN